jgi:hypothetical protein
MSCLKKRKRGLNILILGYYYRNNLGDDTFTNAFSVIFQQCLPDFDLNLNFINTDDVKFIPETTDILVCGAGDIVNDYFVRKIRHLLDDSKYKGPIYTIGIGVTTHKLVEYGYLDFCDHIVLRSEKDREPVENRFGSECVSVS